MILLPERSPPGGSSSSTHRRLAAYQSLPDGDFRARRERKGALNGGGGGRLRRNCKGTLLPVKRTLRSGSKKEKATNKQPLDHFCLFSLLLLLLLLPLRGVNSTLDEGSPLRNGDRELNSLVSTQGYAGHSAKGITF